MRHPNQSTGGAEMWKPEHRRAAERLMKIQEAFEQAGIQFIDDDEIGGFGVRMAKKKKKRS